MNIDAEQLVAGMALFALAAVALVFYPVWTRYRRDRSLRSMAVDPVLTEPEVDRLRITLDADTFVIERPRPVPQLTREVSQPRRARITLNPPRRAAAVLADDTTAAPPR